MRESKISYHRLVDCEELGAFTFEDGIILYGTTVNNQTCLNCGPTEWPVEVKEIFNPNVIEKRKINLSGTQAYPFKKIFL